MNCDSTRFSIIDINGVLSFYDLKVDQHTTAGQKMQMGAGEHLP
jgi:hypothetical protein